MPTVLDIVFVALFAIAMPLWDHLVFWPAFRRRRQQDPASARLRFWKVAMTGLWAIVLLGAVLWGYQDRSLTALGFTMPNGWRLWVSIALVVLLVAYQAYAAITIARIPDVRATARKQMEPIANVLPHTRNDLRWFYGVSLTAGFCEEFLYRGYFIAVFSTWLGWWGPLVSPFRSSRWGICTRDGTEYCARGSLARFSHW